MTIDDFKGNLVYGDLMSMGTNKVEEGVEGKGISQFSSMLTQALDSANGDQVYAQNIMQQAIVDPDSVEAHQVTTAMAKAEMSLQLTKKVVDGVVQAYKDIINMR